MRSLRTSPSASGASRKWADNDVAAVTRLADTLDMVDRIEPAPVLVDAQLEALPPRDCPVLAAEGGSVLALPGGTVAAALRRVASAGRRDAYELRIANESPETVAAYTYALPIAAGGRVWQGTLVPAFSSLAVRVEVPTGSRRSPTSLVTEINAAGTRLTIGAPLRETTGGSARRLARRSLRGFLLAALILGSLGGGTYLGRQHAGSDTPTLARHASVRVAGKAPVHARHVLAVRPRPTIAPLAVAALRVPVSAQSGQSVRIAYTTQATGGSVALIDEFGRILARTELSLLGSSVLLVPNVDAAQDLDVVVAATRDGQHTSAAAPLFVRPAPHPTPAARPSAAVALSADGAARAGHQSSLDIGTGSLNPIAVASVQSSGRPIVVRVLAHPGELHLALVADGTTLADRDVPADAQRVVFPAPAQARNVSLVTTYRNGSGLESTIDSIVLRPHG